MKKAKRNSVLTIIVFILVLALGTFTVVQGLGKNQIGKAENIILGLDLVVSVSHIRSRRIILLIRRFGIRSSVYSSVQMYTRQTVMYTKRETIVLTLRFPV